MKLKNVFLYLHCAFNNLPKGSLFGNDIKEHLPVIYDESKKVNPKLIVELGVRGGDTTKCLAQIAEEENADFFSVDIEDCSNACKYKKWNFLRQDSVKAAENFKKKNVDVLLIDTSHEYEHTKKEISAWFPLLSKNAVVFFHDTNAQFIYSRKNGTLGVASNLNRAVIRAIEEHYHQKFVETEDFEKYAGNDLLSHFCNSNGLLVIKKNKTPPVPKQ